MSPWEERPIWFDVWTRHPPRRDPVLLERVPINALGYRDRRNPDFNFQQPPKLVYKTDYVRAHYRKTYIDTPISCIESHPTVLPLSDRIASRMVQLSKGDPDQIEMDDLSQCYIYAEACRDLCVPEYQSAEDIKEMFVWYKKKQASRRRMVKGNVYKARYERGGPLTGKERRSIYRSMDYAEAYKEIQRRARSSRLERAKLLKEKREKRKERLILEGNWPPKAPEKTLQVQQIAKEKKPKVVPQRITPMQTFQNKREEQKLQAGYEFVPRMGSKRTPQVKSVYTLLREILSKKVERLEEARLAAEKAKVASGKSGFGKLGK